MATSVSAATTSILACSGGGFLLEDRSPDEVFTPEDLTTEQRQIAETAARFAREQIQPVVAEIEAKDPGVMRGLLEKAAELGFTAVDVPEEYDGLGSDKTTSALVADHISICASFSTAFGAHVGIGTLPLVWYGTETQKQRYLPRLATAEIIGAYALSEATSGSDAMNIRTRAVLSPEKTHYILNGEKMWISNAGFADLFTVFVRIVQEKPEAGEQPASQFSAFLIERGTPGFTIGKEEHKLGIRGSSTCALIFSDCRVPVENLLGEAGKGHHIAFNILNMGRFKLGAACVGGGRQAVEQAIRYARDRVAFGKPIAEFGLIQRKIAAMATRLFVTETMTYRVSGMMDAALAALPAEAAHSPGEIQKRIEEYAVECSILKVFGSEMLDFCADELVQIMGGYGYVEDYPAERLYRDSRINRIFEGTNEINRLIITGWLMKRAMSGKLPLLPAIKRLMDEIIDPPASSSFDGEDSDSPLVREEKILANLRKIFLLSSGAASQRYITDLQDQQEIMADLADCIQAIFALESAILRTRKLTGRGTATSSKSASAAIWMTTAYGEEALAIVEQAARRILATSSDGDSLAIHLTVLRRFVRITPADVVAAERQIAHHFLNLGRYRM
jgi:alkylation response protein AidB-like acyl-CoA dehydrogenase